MGWAEDHIGLLDAELRLRADPAAAGPMAAYMKHRFAFFGVAAPARREAQRTVDASTGKPTAENDVIALLALAWERPEREIRYAACDVAIAWTTRARSPVTPSLIEAAGRCIAADPWWDTCDALSRSVVGPIVARHPGERARMDAWLAGDDLWLTRSALLHMGKWGTEIDDAWIFAACIGRADHTDFFIRKAIGWILRDLAWVRPDAVRAFLAEHRHRLSPLSVREAAKHL